MVTKTFKIVCNFAEYLNQETVAQALLEHVTLCNDKPEVFFAVFDNKTERSAVNKGIEVNK